MVVEHQQERGQDGRGCICQIVRSLLGGICEEGVHIFDVRIVSSQQGGEADDADGGDADGFAGVGPPEKLLCHFIRTIPKEKGILKLTQCSFESLD